MQGRINYFFKFSGPSYSVDTACSSSLAAIQLACTAIWNGECDTAVAGGLSVLTSPDLFSGLSRGQFLSKTGSCKTFDNAADGYCRADGIGTVVIKRLKDAETDRDNVLATVLAAGTNHSAHAISITHPHAQTQSDLYRQVLQQAGVDPQDVSYVEMHGTGTQAGDGTEMRSVSDVFAPPSPKARSYDNPLYIGSIKPNLGHGEASSGVASLIKAMTILNKGLIPPHVGIKGDLNAGFPDLKSRNIHIAMQMTAFPERKGTKKTVLVNNFSAAGGNTALLIQEPPVTRIEQNMEPRNAHPVTVSGHTHSALLNNLDRLIAFLSADQEISPLDLSYTTTARRRHHNFRATVVEGSTPRILDALKVKRASLAESIPSKKPQAVVFMFTGQGSAYPAMARELYNTSTQFRADVSHFDGIARQQGFPTFLPMITDANLADVNILSPTQTQIGLVCIQVALARLWSTLGIKPSAVIGHSLGEYAALQVAGVLSVSDMILLVGSRARLLESKCERDSHAMLAVAATASAVQRIAPESVDGIDLACANTPQDSVFAGEKSKIDQLAHKLTREKIRSTQLLLPFAFHSAQVDSILEDFGNIARVVNIGVPHTTIISPTYGRVLDVKEKLDSEYLKQHCRNTVLFAQAILHSREAGVITDMTTLIEIGPHPICSGMVRATLGEGVQTLPTLSRKENPWSAIVGSLAFLHDSGLGVNWSEYQRDFESACRLINLPAYAFDNKNYWIEYRNDWTLRKGDPVPTDGPPARIGDRGEDSKPFISSSVHRVVEEELNAAQPKVVFETALSHPHMHTVISGHRVNGSALCPSSLYADIALTIARYIRDHPDSGLEYDGHDVGDMEVTQPLIVNPVRQEEKRKLRVVATVDKTGSALSLEYLSYGLAAPEQVKHATCRVQFGNPQKWSGRWAHDFHLIKDRIAGLKAASNSGTVNNITQRLTYRLFASLVDYAIDFQRMKQVWLDSASLEAAAIVSLDRQMTDADFKFSPYHLDGLLHLSGFIMNGNENIDSKEAVYISHGWQSLRLAEPLVADASYSVYVKMIPVDKTMVAGNVYVLSNQKIVAVCEGVRFQRVPRAVLNMLLPPVSSSNPRQDTGFSSAVSKEKSSYKSTPGRTSSIPTQTQKLLAPAPLAAKPTSTIGSTRSEQFLQLIASEIGLKAVELKATDSLSDLGVDSLMSLALAGQLTEKFNLNIDHVELMQCATVKDLLGLLDDEPSVPALIQNEEQTSSSGSGSSVSGSVGLGTASPMTRATTPDLKPTHDIETLLYSVILEETGIEEQDLHSSAELMDLGIDSLMSLAILSKLREAGINPSPTVFLDNRTVDDVLRCLSKGRDPSADERRVTDSAILQTASHGSETAKPRAQCILLQKSSLSAAGNSLFLFPDGSGSPSAYAALGNLDPALDVYGLACPFLKTPSKLKDYGIERTAAIYIESILDKWPTSALHLGGWSVGGVLAFEAAKQLTEIHGRQVASLVLIDAPCTLSLPPMSNRLIQFLDSLQLFAPDARNSRSQLQTEKHGKVLDHFDATVASLDHYKPASMVKEIRTAVIWASDGVAGNTDSILDRELLKDPMSRWILEDRGDIGPHGWDRLLPTDRLKVITTPGNHFSMMVGGNAGALSNILREHFKCI